MEATIKIHGHDVTISDADVVNVQDFIPAGESNPHNVRPWVALDHGFVVGVAFADCEQDALDELADSGKLDSFLITEEEEKDYPEGEGVDFLGNHGRPFDVANVELWSLQPPAFSFCALLQASKETCPYEGCPNPVPPGWRTCLNHAAATLWKTEGR